MHTHTHTHTHPPHTHTHTKHTPIHPPTHTHSNMYACIRACTRTCTHTHTHTHTHTRTHTHTHCFTTFTYYASWAEQNWTNKTKNKESKLWNLAHSFWDKQRTNREMTGQTATERRTEHEDRAQGQCKRSRKSPMTEEYVHHAWNEWNGAMIHLIWFTSASVRLPAYCSMGFTFQTSLSCLGYS